MKIIILKMISVVFAIAFIVSALIFGIKDHSDAADVGVRITTKVPAHGHSGPLDGGVLKPQGVSASGSMSCNTGTNCYVVFTTENYDTVDSHPTNSWSFVVPIGYSYGKMGCTYSYTNSGVGTTYVYTFITKNLTGNTDSLTRYFQLPGTGSYPYNTQGGEINTGMMQVSAGDSYQINFQTSGFTINLTATCDMQFYR